ncbi:MAG: type I-E CRISPR-associated protein Cse2/CasB [Bryobacteraceae bacterium]|nr:type I-E CRISPR-associated protein Cse2/CasB [Bryobacterales bacterium]NUN03354.1 type I-E CRISPR-associated protein Cse2/CasB [Bryobacteraceae bacterium]
MRGTRQEPGEEAKKLLRYLRELKNDRGAMADLRCALSPAKLPRAWPLLARVGGIGDRTVETVAGLFAYHPDETGTGNFGTTCQILFSENPSFEGRFRRLLSCADRAELCERLRPVVLAAKAKDVKVNYELLLVDLRYWGDMVKARWAREFWGANEEEDSFAVPEATA